MGSDFSEVAGGAPQDLTAAIRRAVTVVVCLVALAVAAVGCSGGAQDGSKNRASTTVSAASGSGDGSAGRAGGSGSDRSSGSEVQSFAPSDAGFYKVPRPIPGRHHGDLVRVQPIPGAPAGVRWQRIMYRSETLRGTPTVVTGVLSLPDGAPPVGGWPLFAHAHGSTGMADQCAPSVSLVGNGTYAVEIKLLSSWIPDRQIAVVSTDYEGLGGPGLHPMLVGKSEGRSVLDSILAARQVPGVAFADDVGIIGYSQGGHAAAWANQIAAAWTPELHLAGVLAGAPATELLRMVATRDEGTEVILAAALAATDPTLRLDDVLTTAGRRAVDQLDRTCQDTPLPTGELIRVDLTAVLPWARDIAENTPGHVAGRAPTLIVHSAEDLSVPVEGSAVFQDRLCDAGGVVERRVIPEGSHVVAAVTAYDQGISWILALRAGAQPMSTCPDLL